MVDFASGSALFKSLFDLVRGIRDERDDAIRTATAIDLQSKIFDLQAAYAAVLQEKADIEKKIEAMETWNEEKARYMLVEVGTGAFAFVSTGVDGSGEPTHCICAACYQQGKKSILQLAGDVQGSVALACPACKAQILADEEQPNYPFKKRRAKW